ncbi:hypothetical protein SCLCIDRAFT_30580 [Scleroderma citrinum Foug A]|uniref:RRM domain-containing protein n=1 Tax=Scleroderma citrinum Foug A TaxID=1036808 RepID=A0A0C3D2Z9_9AGAM|nr:hypothetical protein SCLCIDRAFT_30580 [Scleroderma citrinum Foug A]
MHSDDSLARLNQALKKLAAEIRRFQRKTCDEFKMYELPNEAAAWHRRQQAQTGPSGPRQLGDHTSQELAAEVISPDGIKSLSDLHHVMCALPCNTFNLASFLRENQSDPAVKNFVTKLKDHLLSRLYGYEYDSDEHSFTEEERNDLQVVGGLNWIIESIILRVNYTTYDIHQEQDVMRPGPACFVMTLSREDEPNAHPFCIDDEGDGEEDDELTGETGDEEGDEDNLEDNGDDWEEISTIFIAGFPDNMGEHKFQHMFIFFPGFVAATLTILNKEDTAYRSSRHTTTMNQSLHGGDDRTTFWLPLLVPSLVADHQTGHFQGVSGRPPHKQIIGFAKFHTLQEALKAKKVLKGHWIDAEKNAILRVEMVKKNLH